MKQNHLYTLTKVGNHFLNLFISLVFVYGQGNYLDSFGITNKYQMLNIFNKDSRNAYQI